MRLKPANELARRYIKELESIAHLPTAGVSVFVSTEDTDPKCDGYGRIVLPLKLFAPGKEKDLVTAFRHELQHARDFLDSIHCDELDEEDYKRVLASMEKRAIKAETKTNFDRE